MFKYYFVPFNSGIVSFKTAPNYENATDTGKDNKYNVVLKATDSSGNVSVQPLIVNINDLDEVDPIITGPGGNKTQGSAAGLIASEINIEESDIIVYTKNILTFKKRVSLSLGRSSAAYGAIGRAVSVAS